MGSGTFHIIDRGIIEQFKSDGYEVDYKEILLEEGFPTEIASTAKLSDKVRVAVNSCIQNQSFPIVLSGNCSATAGVVAGIYEPGLAVFGLMHMETLNTRNNGNRLFRWNGVIDAYRPQISFT